MRREFVAAALLIVGAGIANAITLIPVPTEDIPDLDTLPLSTDGWTGEPIIFSERVYRAIDADATSMRAYKQGEDIVWVYLGFHGSQKGGRPAHTPRGCYPSSGWTILKSDVQTLPFPQESTEQNRFNRMHITQREETRLVRYWFQSDKTIMATGTDMNLFRIRSRLLRKPYFSTFVRIDTLVQGDNPEDLDAAKVLLNEWTERIITFLASDKMWSDKAKTSEA